MVFFVDFARLMSLKHGISETNTMDRLLMLRDSQYLPQDLCSEMIESYEFLMHLRLVHQLRMMEADRSRTTTSTPGTSPTWSARP